MSPEPIRWGIAGTGQIAGEFATALARVDDAELVAVASEDADRLATFAGRYGVPRSHVGYEDLAADDDVDVVYVPSTQERHCRDVLLFLEANRHVLCEKPFALNLRQAELMIETARLGDLFLMEAMWSRFQPSYIRLHELLAEGAIGRPLHLEANFAFRVPDDEIEGHRLFDPHRGGGALLDLGVYPIHLAHFVLGAPESVMADAVLNAQGLDERTLMALRHADGATALLWAGIRTNGSCAARIVGTDGVVHLDPFMHATSKLRLERGFETEELEFPDASLHRQVPEVHRCLREGAIESAVMPHRDTLAIMSTLDEVKRQIGLSFPDE